MKLNFEIIKQTGSGYYPDLIHFPNAQAQVFHIDSGELYGTPSNKIKHGIWKDAVFLDSLDVSPDNSMSHFQVDVLPGFGIVGGYKQNAENKHKLIIYEFAWEMDKYLSGGNIKHNIDNPISSFTLSLENPDINDPEHPGNVAAGEDSCLLSPGAKVVFLFSAGDGDHEFEMGTFYIDRSKFAVGSETASADGRNLIGKMLRDQTLDELYWTDLENIGTIIEEFLQHGKLESDQYLIQGTDKDGWFDFKPNMNILQAIEEIFKGALNWKIEERSDGTVVIGSPDYPGFENRSTYNFYRDKDIFSRQIVRDDMESYRRVCVHNSDFSVMEFADVESYEGWNLQANKTLYVQVPDGIDTATAGDYAEQLAVWLENVGKIESFVGPFRPHLLCGDEATIIDENGHTSLGLITEIEHKFGKSGFYTSFSVDSGGRLGKGRITDFIKQITEGVVPPEQATKTGYTEPERDYLGTLIVYCIDNVSGVTLKREYSTGISYGRWYLYPDGYAPTGYTPVSADTVAVILSPEDPKKVLYFYYTKDD